jgi:Methyltransferase FkbM domain
MKRLSIARLRQAIRWRAVIVLDKLMSAFGYSISSTPEAGSDKIYFGRKSSLRDLSQLVTSLRPIETEFELLRVGGPSDGGYLVPRDLSGIKNCFSAGCDLTWHFEKNLDEEFGISSYILDSEDKRPRDLGPNQFYTPKWLGLKSDSRTITFSDWVSLSNSMESNLLQMDIEGAEYPVIGNASDEELSKFRIIVIELHGLQAMRNSLILETIFRPFFEKLLKNFIIVHAHPNNCCGNWKVKNLIFPRVIELTLLRRDRVREIRGPALTPNSLDVNCVPSKETLYFKWPINS